MPLTKVAADASAGNAAAVRMLINFIVAWEFGVQRQNPNARLKKGYFGGKNESRARSKG